MGSLPDWGTLFGFSVHPLELVLRGSCVYIFLFALFRFVLRRDVGSLGIADVLLLVMIADAAQNAMSGAYQSISEGVVLVGTIAAWNYAIDWLSFRYAAVRRWTDPPPLILIQDGRVLRKNMRRELLTMEELMAGLREQGVDDPALVKRATMEGDGVITVIRKQGQ